MAVSLLLEITTAWKVSKYGVFSDPYFPVFSPITGKYGLEKTPYLDTFHAVIYTLKLIKISNSSFLLCSSSAAKLHGGSSL